MEQISKTDPDVAYREPKWHLAVSGLFISLGAFGLALVNQTGVWNALMDAESSLVPVGTIALRAGAVRIKPEASLTWFDLTGSVRLVRDGDSIFTNEVGEAALVLIGSATVKIMPNSLVVVHRPAKSDEGKPSAFGFLRRLFMARRPGKIALQKGAVDVTLNPGSPMNVTLMNRELHLAPVSVISSFKLAFDPANPSFPSVLKVDPSSHLLLSDETLPQTLPIDLDSGTVASIDRGKIAVQGGRMISYRPFRPKEGEGILRNAGGKIRFRWEWSSPGAVPVRQSRLEVEGSEKRSLPLSPRDKQSELSLPDGLFRWRAIRELQGGKWEESQWTTFSVESMDPPISLGPAEGFVAPTASEFGTAKVNLTWQTVRAGLSVQVELTGKDHPRRLFEGQSEGVELQLTAGKYIWRARKRDPHSGKSSSWGKPRSLVISGTAVPQKTAVESILVASKATDPEIKQAFSWGLPQRPAVQAVPTLRTVTRDEKQTSTASHEPATPANPRIEFSLQKAMGSARFKADGISPELLIPLSWHSVPSAASYRVLISSARGVPIAELSVSGVNQDVRLDSFPDAGIFYEVTALDSGDRVLARSKAPISVRNDPVILMEPANGSKMAHARKVFMTWARAPFSDGYQIQIARDPQFSSVSYENKSDKNVTIYIPSQSGMYYWRVMTLMKGYRSDWSETRAFEIQ